MSERQARWISILAGLAALAVAVTMGRVALAPCGGLAGNYRPVIAFELARSVPDLAKIFGPGKCTPDQAATLVDNLNRVNLWDMAAFIPAYGAFLFFFFFTVRAAPWWRLGAALVVLACAADYWEDWCLAGLATQHTGPSHYLALLPWATAIKWIGLGVALALGGLALACRGTWRWLTVLTGLAGLAATVLAIWSPADYGPRLNLPIGVAFLAIFLAELAEAFIAQAAARSDRKRAE